MRICIYLLSVFLVLPSAAFAEEQSRVFDDFAGEMLETMDPNAKVAIQPFDARKVDLPDKITTGFNNRLVDSLLKKSNFKIKIIERAKLLDIWKEAEEFGAADFNKLVAEAGAEILIIGDLRLRKGGVEISYRGYDLRQGQRGKIIASTRTQNLDFDLAEETSIPVSDELGEVFLQIMKSGGIIANAKKPEEFYANARMYEQKGDSGNARRSYAKFFTFDLDYIDPHLRYQKYLKIQEGREGARELYSEMKEDSKSFITEYASILLFSRKTRVKKLEKFMEKHPEFGPGYLELSKEFSEARLGEQTQKDKGNEKKYLEKFYELHEQGKFLKYFMDKDMASKFLDNAGTRMTALKTFDDSILKNPVSIRPRRSNSAWNFEISVIDMATELFYRFEGDDEFTSTGFTAYLNPLTGKKMPTPQFFAPLDQGKTKIYFKYKGVKGEEHGPFAIDFDPEKALIDYQIAVLKQGSSFLPKYSHRGFDNKHRGGRDIFSFSSLQSYACGIDKVMYAFDDDKNLDKEFHIRECDQDNPHGGAGPGGMRHVDGPLGVKFLASQIFFKDGTKSEVQITKAIICKAKDFKRAGEGLPSWCRSERGLGTPSEQPPATSGSDENVAVLPEQPPATSGADLKRGEKAYERGDYAAALREFRPLAEQGTLDAQYNLGVMYFEGRGVAKDYVQAYMWFNLVAAKGDDYGKKGRDLVEKKMTPTQVEKAQKLTREWTEKHPK